MYLNCHTYHSLRYGTIPPEDLVQQAKDSGVQALALTDVNTVTGIYDFIRACQKGERKIKPLVGIEFRTEHKLNYIGLAKSYEGMGEMCQALTLHNLGKKKLPLYPEFTHVAVIYPFENVPSVLKEDEYIGLRPEQLVKLYREDWKSKLHKMVIRQPVTFRTPDEYRLHKILRAMETNCILSRLEEDLICQNNEVMKPVDELLSLYKDYPQIIKNTERLIEDCHYSFEFKTSKNKKYFTGSSYCDLQQLTRLAEEGMARRYGKNAEAERRIKKELEVIDKLNFSAYFLITHDIVQYSNRCGFMHVGRGSGANSIVSYCLGITDICPIELDLYFERFLNEHRKSPPDFDIDWSWKDRDTILKYIFEKYSKEKNNRYHVAFCGTNVEFKYRSIFRETGKVFGLPKEELDQLAKNPMKFHPSNKVMAAIQKYGLMLEKYPNQRSMHPCGILISEEPLTHFSALELPPKGFPIVQFDMHVAEEIGLEKFDILSQRGLGTIHDTVRLVKENRGVEIDIRNISLSKDEAVCNDYLKRGKTIGCFYVESPAMRGLLRRLNCDNYKVLVAASSIIRPGVAQSGMMREYVFRHNNPGKFEYFHPVFREQLAETYGVMVYQEDVIKIALHFGGISAAKADILRRAISGKSRSLKELDSVKENYFESCQKAGHSPALSQEVFRQISSFAGYSFCKAHSASYAIESYQSLYLKVHYPIEFMVSAINNFGGFYRTEIYLHEAKMSGACLHNPCINTSKNETLVTGKDIYLGFIHLKSLNQEWVTALLHERNTSGLFTSLEDFINRVPVSLEVLKVLIFIGAFRFTGKSKNELILMARLLLANFKPENRTLLLLYGPVKQYQLPRLDRLPFEDAFDEIELLGFPLSYSPFDLLQTPYRGDVMVKDLQDYHKKEVKMLGYLVSQKQVRTKAGIMYFGTWIDACGEFFDSAHFADSVARYPFAGGGCYLLLGVVQVDYNFPTVVVSKMGKMPFIADPRYG